MSVYTRTEAAEVGACQGINQPFVRLCRHPRSPRPPARPPECWQKFQGKRATVCTKICHCPPKARAVGPSRSVDPCNSSHDIHTTRKRTSPPAPVINATFFLAVLFHPSVCLSSPLLALFLVRPVSFPRGNSSYRPIGYRGCDEFIVEFFPHFYSAEIDGSLSLAPCAHHIR